MKKETLEKIKELRSYLNTLESDKAKEIQSKLDEIVLCEMNE